MARQVRKNKEEGKNKSINRQGGEVRRNKKTVKTLKQIERGKQQFGRRSLSSSAGNKVRWEITK